MKIVRVLTIILVVGLAGVSGRGVVQAGGSQFTTVDDPNGVHGTLALSINPKGDIVGYYFDSTRTPHGFLLSEGRYTTIDNPNGVHGTQAMDINPRGDIVGSYFDSTSTPHGFLLSHG